MYENVFGEYDPEPVSSSGCTENSLSNGISSIVDFIDNNTVQSETSRENSMVTENGGTSFSSSKSGSNHSEKLTSLTVRQENEMKIPLYEGHKSTAEVFFDDCEKFAVENNISQKGQRQLFNLFVKHLPQPNTILHLQRKQETPQSTIFEYGDSKLLFLDVKSQLSLIFEKNQSLFEKSWNEGGYFTIPDKPIQRNEIQLILNIDGVPVFKSRKFNVWPFWLTCVNLPPKTRGMFQNISLMALWHGIQKPNWQDVLRKVKFELENLSNGFEVESLGVIKCKVELLVCDMPAKANALNMNQFNGFNGCTHCLLVGTRKNHRLLYSCCAQLKLRDRGSFERHARRAEANHQVVAGIKGLSPLSSILAFPKDAPIDAMHQVFLGTGKTLCKLFIDSLRPRERTEFDSILKTFFIPLEFLRKPKNVCEVNFWKAADYKLLFFHLLPLSLDCFNRMSSEHKKSFQQLSLAVKLLSLKHIEEQHITSASNLIEEFFTNFVRLYGEDLQTYNFHSLRHLCDQVKNLGPLWNFSAFAFESANHYLIRALSGTIKKPERIAEQFVANKRTIFKHLEQRKGASSYSDEEQFSKLTNVSLECQDFCEQTFASAARTYMGRFKGKEGLLFHSNSYTRLNGNLSNCIVWTKKRDFFFVETFVSLPSQTIAVVRQYKNVEVLPSSSFPMDQRMNHLYQLSNIGKLQVLDARKAFGKCVLRRTGYKSFSASLVSEGFEHN